MANELQVALWDDQVGDAWVANASMYDAMLEPLGAAAMERLVLSPGDRVLDIGCGTGATTVELARRVAESDGSGLVLGVDLSRRMLDAARQRARWAKVGDVDFVAADVQTADLGRHRFDAAYSRMGVMFFDDPVAAFSNVAGALVAGGQLAFCCFQRPEDNPVVILPVLATAGILGLDPPDPDGPGPFSLADARRTTELLGRAGFVDVVVEAGPDRVEFGPVEDLEAVAERMLEQNPVTNPRLSTADDATRAAALAAMTGALAAYRHDADLSIAAATWIVTARTPD